MFLNVFRLRRNELGWWAENLKRHFGVNNKVHKYSPNSSIILWSTISSLTIPHHSAWMIDPAVASDSFQFIDPVKIQKILLINLIGTVNFPTWIVKDSRTAIDNIYIHETRNYTINPVINGLSDHDAQMITMDNIMRIGQPCNPQYVRNYSNFNVNKFQEMLSYELWDDVFTNDNVNNIFNEFLNTYVKFFYSCFTKKNYSQI
jgi:hypothetical protein